MTTHTNKKRGLSQKIRILAYLKGGGVLTPILALEEFGCMRPAARIFELREEGHDIEDIGKGFAKYILK